MKGDETFFHMMIAHRVLSIGVFSKAERLVGNALLGHFNTKTRVCDPGTKRLCAMLGMHRGTLFIALGRLCGERGLFERITYGGRSHRNLYRPKWDRFEQLNNQFTSDPAKAKRELVQKRTRQLVQKCTTNDNDINEESPLEPRSGSPTKNHRNGQAGWNGPSGSATKRQVVPDQRPSQSDLIHSLEGGQRRSPSHGQVANNRAIAAWDRSLRAKLGSQYGDALELITEPMAEAATAAELSRRGAGLYHILAALERAGLGALRSSA